MARTEILDIGEQLPSFYWFETPFFPGDNQRDVAEDSGYGNLGTVRILDQEGAAGVRYNEARFSRRLHTYLITSCENNYS